MPNDLFSPPSGGNSTLRYARTLIGLGGLIIIVLLVGLSLAASGGSKESPVQAAGTLYNTTDAELAAAETQAKAAAEAWLGMAYPADAASFGTDKARYLQLVAKGSPAEAAYGKLSYDAARGSWTDRKVGELEWTSFPYRNDAPCTASFSYRAAPASADGTGTPSASSGTYSVTLEPVTAKDGTVAWSVSTDSGVGR